MADYFVFIIERTDIIGRIKSLFGFTQRETLMSASETPTLPRGYSKFKKLGAVRRISHIDEFV